jgi:hypothetical protein
MSMRPVPVIDPGPPGGVPLTAVYRNRSSEQSGFVFLDETGAADFVPTNPGLRNYPATVWTGERFVTAWEEEDTLRIAVSTADGVEERLVDVDPLERPGAITLGAFPGRVGVLVSRYREPETRDQWFIELDATGNVIFSAWQAPSGGDMHVEVLDSRGNVRRGWSGPTGNPDGMFVDPHFVRADDRIVMIWHGSSPDSTPNFVMTQSFGCTP